MNRKPSQISRGGGGSIRIGSVGTVSSLMSKELESSSTPSRRSPQSEPVSVSCGERRLKLRKSMDRAQKPRGQHQDRISVLGLATPKPQRLKGSVEEARGLGNTRRPHQDRISALGLASLKQQKQKDSMEESRSPEFSWRTRSHKRAHHVPMLGSEDKAVGANKVAWKVNLVEVADTNCGIPAGNLSSRLKKLGFARLSQSII